MSEMQIYKLIKEIGSRFTPQRQSILTFLKECDSHPSADEIFNHLRDDHYSLSIATVYNALNLFIEHGLVRELKLGKSCSRYEWYHDDHAHAYCTSCGKLADFLMPGMDHVHEEVGRLTSYQYVAVRLIVYGQCEECQAKIRCRHSSIEGSNLDSLRHFLVK